MPLVRGYSKATRTKNIAEVLKSYQQTGMIGNTRPKNKEHARKIATAIAYDKQRKSK